MSRFEAWLLDGSVAISFFSGLAYWVMREFLRPSDPFSIVGHPWQPHMLAAHVLVGPVFVLALGLILRDHVIARFRAGRPLPGRASGVATVLVAAPMVATGYLLQIATDPGLRRFLGAAHLLSGLLFGALFAGHVVASVLRRRAAAAPGVAGEVGAP